MKMRRTVRNAWVKALRSGEYEQGKGALATIEYGADDVETVTYCCLGVLCELAIAGGVAVEHSDEDTTAEGYRLYGGQKDFPPDAVRDWAAGPPAGVVPGWIVLRADSDFAAGATHAGLAVANDDGGVSFAGIADLIENDLDAAYDDRDDYDLVGA